MIHKRMYLGIPMASRRNRRVLVVGYWIAVVLILACATIVYRRVPEWFDNFGMAIALGAIYGLMLVFLGGGARGFLSKGGSAQMGPVADFEGDQTPPPRWALLEIVDRLLCRLRGVRSNDRFVSVNQAFDERDVHLRDHAHYQAYRIFRPVLGVAGIFILVIPISSDGLDLIYRDRFLLFPLMCFFILVFWNLPQSMILWTEPDMEDPQQAN